MITFVFVIIIMFLIELHLYIIDKIVCAGYLWGTNLDRASAPPPGHRDRGSATAPRPGRIAAR